MFFGAGGVRTVGEGFWRSSGPGNYDDGKPVVDTNVELLDSTGKEVQEVTSNASGYVEFCDFETGAHSVVVRSPCMVARIDGIRLHVGFTNELQIIRPSCRYHVMGTPGCSAIVRVRSPFGPILDATVSTKGIREPIEGDKYGRHIFGMYPGTESVGEIRAKGYKNGTFQIKCDGSEVVQETVVLAPLPW